MALSFSLEPSQHFVLIKLNESTNPVKRNTLLPHPEVNGLTLNAEYGSDLVCANEISSTHDLRLVGAYISSYVPFADWECLESFGAKTRMNLQFLKIEREKGVQISNKNSPICYTLALPLDQRLLRS